MNRERRAEILQSVRRVDRFIASDVEDLLAAYEQIARERDEAMNDARMGHARRGRGLTDA